MASENSLLVSLHDELHDARRVQAYGQEDDLKEALGRMIARVEELSSLLSQAHKAQSELETSLILARSNLQLALANNEMLEEALKRDSVGGGRDVGWRRNAEQRAPPKEQSVERAKRSSADSTRPSASRRTSGDVPGASSPLATPAAGGDASTPNSPANPSTSPPATTHDSRFFRFRFGSSPTPTPTASGSTSRPHSPPPTQQVLRRPGDAVREATHLTSASLPSLVATNVKREEELVAELESERGKYAKVCKEKSALEQEIEGLSQALFEEANKMVAHERIKCAEIEEELREVRQEKEALKSAMRIIELENSRLKSPTPLQHASTPVSVSAPDSADADSTPRGSRPSSRAGPATTQILQSPKPKKSQLRQNSSLSQTVTEPTLSSSPPNGPRRSSGESNPPEREWTPPKAFSAPTTPMPDLPVESSPWSH